MAHASVFLLASEVALEDFSQLFRPLLGFLALLPTLQVHGGHADRGPELSHASHLQLSVSSTLNVTATAP